MEINHTELVKLQIFTLAFNTWSCKDWFFEKIRYKNQNCQSLNFFFVVKRHSLNFCLLSNVRVWKFVCCQTSEFENLFVVKHQSLKICLLSNVRVWTFVCCQTSEFENLFVVKRLFVFYFLSSVIYSLKREIWIIFCKQKHLT